MGNKTMVIIIAVVVVVFAVLGFGVAGIVNIPGLTKPKPKHSKAKVDPKAEEAKAAEDKKVADDAAKKQAADAFQKVVAQRDDAVKAGQWDAALPLAQQVSDSLAKDKPGSPELSAATQLVAHVKDESDKAKLPKPDESKGYAKLAAVWAEMEPDKVKGILTAQYKPDVAAPILKRMDEDKVAAVLALMEPKEAAGYSEALAKEASKPPPAPAS